MLREIGAVKTLKARMVGKDGGRQGTALDPQSRDDRQRHRQGTAAETAEIVDHGNFFFDDYATLRFASLLYAVTYYIINLVT